MTGLNVVQKVGAGRYWPYRYDMSTKTLYTATRATQAIANKYAHMILLTQQTPS
jgi:hypothetical protein